MTMEIYWNCYFLALNFVDDIPHPSVLWWLIILALKRWVAIGTLIASRTTHDLPFCHILILEPNSPDLLCTTANYIYQAVKSSGNVHLAICMKILKDAWHNTGPDIKFIQLG